MSHKTTKNPITEIVNKPKQKYTKIDPKYVDLEPAANLIVSALMYPQCAEVRNALSKYIDYDRNSLNFKLLDKDLAVSLKQLSSPSKIKAIKQTGGAPLNICIIAGLSIVLISLSIYLFSIYTENVHYKMNCAQYSDIINPPQTKIVESYLSTFYKMGRMSINKVQIDQCKKLDEIRSKRFYDIVESVHNMTSDLTAIIKTVGSIIIFLVLLFSKGLKALACLATKYIDLSDICDINCSDIPTAKKASSPKPAAAAEEPQEEEQQEE
jgi:hypothetical protein